MAEWPLRLDPQFPVSVLEQLGAIAREFPGDDRLVLLIGDRKLVVPVGLSPALRAAVARTLEGA